MRPQGVGQQLQVPLPNVEVGCVLERILADKDGVRRSQGRGVTCLAPARGSQYADVSRRGHLGHGGRQVIGRNADHQQRQRLRSDKFNLFR
jgi:hypothetical protein